MEQAESPGTFCTSCGQHNPSQARFCARCGTALSTEAMPSPPAASASPTPVTGESRISVVSAAICMFPIALVAGVLFSPVYVHYYGDPLARVSPWIGIGFGAAVSLGLSSRLRLVGRLPSALGIMLIAIRLILDSVSNFPLGLIPYGVAGLGVGLLFPLAFWRHISQVSPVGKAVLAVDAVAGVVIGWSAVRLLGFGATYGVAAVFALFIGLPAVLISPIVRVPR